MKLARTERCPLDDHHHHHHQLSINSNQELVVKKDLQLFPKQKLFSINTQTSRDAFILDCIFTFTNQFDKSWIHWALGTVCISFFHLKNGDQHTNQPKLVSAIFKTGMSKNISYGHDSSSSPLAHPSNNAIAISISFICYYLFKDFILSQRVLFYHLTTTIGKERKKERWWIKMKCLFWKHSKQSHFGAKCQASFSAVVAAILFMLLASRH